MAGWRGSAIGVIVALLVIASIWLPALRHDWVSVPSLPDDSIETARAQPPDAVLRRLVRQSLAIGTGIAADSRRRAADDLLGGRLELPGYPGLRLGARFDASEPANGPPTWALQLASLAVADILLDGYEASGERRYLDAARDYIVEFAAREKALWLDDGFIRNDHAIAARVGVLTRFWLHYRSQPNFELPVARTVLDHLLRCRAFLADPSHFTAATNHGVMQNTALLQAVAAFPSLPASDRLAALAMRRLAIQFRYYLSPEGVVLEHSAGYHAHGLALVDQVFDLATHLALPIPPDWVEKRRLAIAFLDTLRRPDGSLPVFGNTGGVRGPVGGPDPCRSPGLVLDWLPVSGYAVWRDCSRAEAHGYATAAHTTVAWSYFPGHGHKLADEGSVIIWARGRPWITNVGYWPYGARGRADVDGWAGSNALHLANEPRSAERETRVLGQARLDDGAFLDLRRSATGGELRRQVLFLRPGTWVVVDSARGSVKAQAEHAWTVYPVAALTRSSATDGWRAEDGSQAMDVLLAGDGGSVSELRGSFYPFGGWTVVGAAPQPTTTLRREFPADGRLAVTVFVAHSAADKPRAAATLAAGSSVEHWSLRVDAGPDSAVIDRDGPNLKVAGPGGLHVVRVDPPPDVASAYAGLRSAFNAAIDEFPRYRNLNAYRWKVTRILLVVLLAQELVCLLFRRVRVVPVGPLRWAAVCGWSGLAAWLGLVYFAP